jgi:uncharacterized protein YndB with AHSA1/START domain
LTGPERGHPARNGRDGEDRIVIEVSREVAAGPERVFRVLADGWSYAGWVVGNSHVRRVDEDWPAVGARIHHSAGFWPVQLHDDTEVLAVVPDRLLELDARLWYLGAARIRFTLTPLADGARTRITMGEQVVRGPGSTLPLLVQSVLLRPRNSETLARLGDLAAGRASG